MLKLFEELIQVTEMEVEYNTTRTEALVIFIQTNRVLKKY